MLRKKIPLGKKFHRPGNNFYRWKIAFSSVWVFLLFYLLRLLGSWILKHRCSTTGLPTVPAPVRETVSTSLWEWLVIKMAYCKNTFVIYLHLYCICKLAEHWLKVMFLDRPWLGTGYPYKTSVLERSGLKWSGDKWSGLERSRVLKVRQQNIRQNILIPNVRKIPNPT